MRKTKKYAKRRFMRFTVLIVICIFTSALAIHLIGNNPFNPKSVDPILTKEEILANYMDKLNIDKTLPVITVDQNGQGDFVTINAAIKHISDASIQAIIFVQSGDYIENLSLIGSTATIIIGENVTETKIISYDDDYYHPPMEVSGNAIFANIQFLALRPEIPKSSKSKFQTYAVHIDFPGEGKIIFQDCVLFSAFNSGVGIGTHENQTIQFSSTMIMTDEQNSSAFYAHNNIASDVKNQNIIIDGATLYSEYSHGLRIDDANQFFGNSYGNDMTFSINNSTVRSGNSDVSPVYFLTDPKPGLQLSGCIKLSPTSSGNSTDMLNYK